MASPPKADTRRTLDAFMLTLHRASHESGHAAPVKLAELAKELGIPEPLAEKIATFLESEGLVDYDDQAVDITIPGMLQVEGMGRPRAKRPA